MRSQIDASTAHIRQATQNLREANENLQAGVRNLLFACCLAGFALLIWLSLLLGHILGVF